MPPRQSLPALPSLPGNATDSNASFGSPQGIAVDSRGRLFVSDGLNKRVLVFLVVDTELEAQYARNKVEAARAAVNDAALQVSAAQSKVDAIVASGCTDGGNARAYLHVASDRLAIANNSLASADFMLARSNYSEAQAHADSAVSFANESAQSANDSARYADEFNAAAGSAVTGMNAALGLFSEADGLNATAARLNITLRNLSALDTAHFSYNIAEARCGEANYASAEKDAEDAQGNATAAIGNMRQQINLAIIPAYAQLRDEFALVKGNVTLYDLPIDTTPVEIDLSLANTLILDSKYEDALSRMASVRANLTIIQERVDSYTSEVEARRLYLGAALNSTRGRLSGLAALAQNYSQHPDFARANGLVRSAEANLSLGDLSATNASLGQANLELDGLNESLQGRIALIGNAAAAIGQAKADVARAEAAGIPFFGANTASAHSDISAAEAVLYSDPESASRLALNASSTARAEEARLNSQRPMVLGVAVGVLLLLVAAFLVFTGAMAGVYTLIRHLRKKAREEEAKLEAALLGRSGKAGEKQEAAPRKGRKRRPEMEAS